VLVSSRRSTVGGGVLRCEVSDNSAVERARTRLLGGVGGTIERRSTAEQTAGVLRAAILAGRLLPGVPLRELPLAEELGVSRTSIREAVRILEGEHLVRYRMNRGAVVAELSDEEICSRRARCSSWRDSVGCSN
jgi:predicted transcriptional regulator